MLCEKELGVLEDGAIVSKAPAHEIPKQPRSYNYGTISNSPDYSYDSDSKRSMLCTYSLSADKPAQDMINAKTYATAF